MSNFFEPHTEFEGRISEFLIKLERIDRFVARQERRAARAQFESLLDEIQAYSNTLSIPVDTMVVGAQLGFMSGGKLLRGRLPAALMGAAMGWLYGQHERSDQRETLNHLVKKAALTANAIDHLERKGKSETR